MTCVKKIFKSENQAEAYSRFNKVLRPEKKFQRAYKCPKCHKWHLSSKDSKSKLDHKPVDDILKQILEREK